MHEDVIGLVTLVELGKTFNELRRVVEASSENESLVRELLTVGEGKFVGVGFELGDGGAGLNLRPSVDHGGESSSLHLQSLDVRVKNTEVGLGLNPDGVLGDHSDLKVSSTLVLLDELGESTAMRSTYKHQR